MKLITIPINAKFSQMPIAMFMSSLRKVRQNIVFNFHEIKRVKWNVRLRSRLVMVALGVAGIP